MKRIIVLSNNNSWQLYQIFKMNHSQQLQNLMQHYNFKTKKELQTQIKQILNDIELGEIMQNDDLLQDLLKKHPQYNSNTSLYFKVSLDSQ